KASMSAEVLLEAVDASWPAGMISLSHIALPFPPDDPLYGRGPAPSEDTIFLGQMDVRGERGLLRFPTDWLMRLRHNPFYDYQQSRVLEWLDSSR
ncbi:MAG: alpha/beta hydrolase, partial [Thermoanaerobaculia bacterium]